MQKEAEENTDKQIVMSLIRTDGSTYEATLLTIFKAGSREYAAFLSHVPNEEGQLPIQLFRFKMIINDGEEGVELDNIQSDMEAEEAYNAFLPLLEEYD